MDFYCENTKFRCKKKRGPIPSRLHSPTPHVLTGETVSSATGITSLSLKPATHNSLELISVATGGRDVSTSGVHSWNVSPDTSSSTLVTHREVQQDGLFDLCRGTGPQLD
jgi:hypothetical protein